MIVTIHQPEHLPWLGFFDKVRQGDCFVMLDHVQFRRRYFQNRNRIRTPDKDGYQWITVPVQAKGKYDQPINEVLIDNGGNPRWQEKCLRTIELFYRKAPFFGEHFSFFEILYRTKWERLVDLNTTIIHYLLLALGIHVQVLKSSELGVSERKGRSDA